MTLVIWLVLLGPILSLVYGTGVGSKLEFSEADDSSREISEPDTHAILIPALVRTRTSFQVVTAQATDNQSNTNRTTSVRQSAALTQADVQCNSPCSTNILPLLLTNVPSPKLQPALCDSQGRCYLTLEPSYNISDKDITTTLDPITTVPVYTGIKVMENDKENSPSQNSDTTITKPNTSTSQFLRKLIPNYDFPVVSIFKGIPDNHNRPSHNPTHPPVDRTLVGIVYPVRRVHSSFNNYQVGSSQPPANTWLQYHPSSNPSSQSRPQSNFGHHYPGVSHHKYPYPYAQYGVRTHNYQNVIYLNRHSQTNSMQSSSGAAWHVDQGAGNRRGCYTLCPGLMEHRGGTTQRKPQFNISGKLDLPGQEGGEHAALRKAIHIDGKLGGF